MAKARKPLTKEEELALQKKKAVASIDTEYHFIHAPEPTYFFNVGDKVRYGAMDEAVVEEIFKDGKIYLLRCTLIKERLGVATEDISYHATCWYHIRPIMAKNTKTNFAKEKLHIQFLNCTVESLLFRYYRFGVDLNPVYQRGYVWCQEDKKKLIQSIFDDVDIGKFVFVRLSNEEWFERDVMYEILDGKQRLSTLIEFYENRFPYNGKYFNDLDPYDKRAFLNHPVSVGEIGDVDKKTIYSQFLKLNRTGKPISKEHLEKVEKLLLSE